MTDEERTRVERVLSEHRRFIESVAAQHAPTPSAVPDIVQQVSLKLCRRFHSFQGRSRLSTWLIRITINEARVLHRQEQRRQGRERFWHDARDAGLDPAGAGTDLTLRTAQRRAASNQSIAGGARMPRLVRKPHRNGD